MVDYTDPRWNESDSQNTSPSPNGITPSSSPSAIPAVIRAGMGAQKRTFDRENARGLAAASGNAYSLTYDVSPVQYEKGEFFSFFVPANNTGPATFNINGLGTRDLVQSDGTALAANDLVSGAPATVTYDGSKFRMVTAAGNPSFKGGTINGGTIWAASNDGVGSTLDADLLDGQQGAWYQARANHTGLQDVATISGLQALLDAIVPAGTVIYVAGAAVPTGYLAANGGTGNRTTHARLFAAIGTTYGAGDGSTTFGLPDLRGVFARGLDSGRGIDTGRVLGSFQDSANLAHAHGVTDPGHTHTGSTNTTGDHSHTLANTPKGGGSEPWNGGSGSDWNANTGGTTGIDGAHSHTVSVNSNTTGITIQSNGGSESRPKNVALLACIKL